MSLAVSDLPAMPDSDDDEPTPKRRTLDPMLRQIDRVFAAMEDLDPSVQQIALTLVNAKFCRIDESVLDPCD